MNCNQPTSLPPKRAARWLHCIGVLVGWACALSQASAQAPGYPPLPIPPQAGPQPSVQTIDPGVRNQAPQSGQVFFLPNAPTSNAPGATTEAKPVANTVPPVETASPALRAKVETLIDDIQDPDVRLDLLTRKSRLVRTKLPVMRVAIADPSIVETVQFGPTEFELIGRTPGETTMTLWFHGAPQNGYPPSLRYLIKVTRDEQNEDQARIEYGALQRRINELFPNSYIQLIPVLDKLIVRGQARDAAEAAQIMSVLRGESIDQSGATLGPGAGFGWGGGGGGFGMGGRMGRLYGANDMPASSVVNMITIPGEQQVMLKVRIAELSRAALREMGASFSYHVNDVTFNGFLGIAGAGSVVLNNADVQLTLSALASNNTNKVLAEPNLVTLSGFPASFIAGGSFAVPTALVGAAGGLAATTSFQGFGTQIQFTPTVLDKDHIRLQVTPTFSEINSGNSVNGIPGLNTRSVFTTVDLREGQWLAIAGLLQDQMQSSKVRIPWIGDIPILGGLFSHVRAQRAETELVVLVSPELIHPLEPDQMPLILTGMEVTEPDDAALYLRQRWEGNPDVNHRSTVWPIYQQDNFDARLRACRAAKSQSGFMSTEQYYMSGPFGFSN
ncbi:MAG: pilus assembly protein N-terminal domain-containing protein [Planctomycetes bacterium]|nr:pilus assembly protein N-terminal domain-containing protein [Planctomycetota bacterium]